MSAQETFPPDSLVRKHPRWLLWHGVTGRVVAVMPHPTTAMVRVQWANRAGSVLERADDLLPVPETPRDDSAEREAIVSEQTTFPVGARVRERCVPFRSGLVVISYGDPGDVWVRWDGQRIPDPVDLGQMEVIAPEPARAPARTLAPGIEVYGSGCY